MCVSLKTIFHDLSPVFFFTITWFSSHFTAKMSSFLGEVHFEDLPSGRVRCLETGHEMPASEKEGYGNSKKCRRILFDQSLSRRTPPLNVFEQSPTLKDKVICKLTGDILNKSEEAIWKHISGKKFLRKLAQKEAEKSVTSMQRDKNSIKNNDEDFEENVDAMDCEGPDFWIPMQDSDSERSPSVDLEQKGGNGCSIAEATGSTGIKRKAKRQSSRPTIKKKKQQ